MLSTFPVVASVDAMATSHGPPGSSGSDYVASLFTDYDRPLIMRAASCSVLTASSGSCPVVSGERFSSRFVFRFRQSVYSAAIFSALCVVNPGRQNQLFMGGRGLNGGPVGIHASIAM